MFKPTLQAFPRSLEMLMLLVAQLSNSFQCYGQEPTRILCHEILQARILEWFAMLFSRGSSQPRDQAHVSGAPCVGMRVLYHWSHLGSPCLCNSDNLSFPRWLPPISLGFSTVLPFDSMLLPPTAIYV